MGENQMTPGVKFIIVDRILTINVCIYNDKSIDVMSR